MVEGGLERSRAGGGGDRIHNFWNVIGLLLGYSLNLVPLSERRIGFPVRGGGGEKVCNFWVVIGLY